MTPTPAPDPGAGIPGLLDLANQAGAGGADLAAAAGVAREVWAPVCAAIGAVARHPMVSYAVSVLACSLPIRIGLGCSPGCGGNSLRAPPPWGRSCSSPGP
jgi:hypothetical protein